MPLVKLLNDFHFVLRCREKRHLEFLLLQTSYTYTFVHTQTHIVSHTDCCDGGTRNHLIHPTRLKMILFIIIFKIILERHRYKGRVVCVCVCFANEQTSGRPRINNAFFQFSGHRQQLLFHQFYVRNELVRIRWTVDASQEAGTLNWCAKRENGKISWKEKKI